MVHVWYVEYGDTAHNIDPLAIYEQVLTEIHLKDPSAYIEEIRQYTYQIAFYVNHPNWTAARAKGRLVLVDERGLPIDWLIVAGILFAVGLILAAAGFAMKAATSFIQEIKTYPCPGDPGKPETEPCALHKDAEGKVLTYPGYSAFLAHMAAAHPTAFQALKEYNATNWWEGIPNIIMIIAILVGAAIVVPLITKLIPGKEGG